MTSNDFLKKRLGPSEQQPLDGGCLEGTRVDILQEAMDWQDNEAEKNVLWIVGAPGAGKSTIATLVSQETWSYMCQVLLRTRCPSSSRSPSDLANACLQSRRQTRWREGCADAHIE